MSKSTVFLRILSLILVLTLLGSVLVPSVGAEARIPAAAEAANPASELPEVVPAAPDPLRSVNSRIIIDDNAAGGYEGDYVVIYNPSTSASTSYSTGTMTGLIETSVNQSVGNTLKPQNDRPNLVIDVDGLINARDRREDPNYGVIKDREPTRATSYNVGDTRNFTISSYNPGSGTSLNFKVLAKGAHCYIWTPSQNVTNYYTLDSIDPSYAQQAADEFDRMYNLMNSSFGNHSNGSNGDGRVNLLFYNIDDGWNGSGGFVAGYFSGASYSYDSMPIINIDTYPGVYYKTSSGNEGKSMDIAYSTACHEYQHCINYSNTSSMSTWLNECFSAAAEEICYPGSSVVSRIQSWENYFYSDKGDWQTPPAEFEYTSDYTLHKGFSMYNWNNNLEMDDTLALYAQVSFFAQYLYTRFGNSIYKQISNKFSSSEPTAITNATGVNCADLVRDFRVAVTANAALDQYNGVYGFKAQEGYDPAQYNNVANPYSLLGPVVFTGSSCSIKGGGAITVKPVNGVYNPPSGANSNLKYIGIKVNNYEITAVSNNEAWGTVSVTGTTITASPADGYYVEKAEVTQGSGSCTVNGSTILVTATTDCTVLVTFAPKPSYTVSFVASGNAEGSQTALVLDEITLPAAVSVVADGWTFAGWMDHQIEETTEKPEFYTPGASYTVTGNTTLYAVYTRVEEGTGDKIYELVNTAPADWSGNYVISYLTTTNMYVMKGVTPSSNGADIENTNNASTYAASGVTLDGTTLSNVANSYVFTLEPHGSYYSIKSAATGTYLGIRASDGYLGGYTSYTANYCDWTPGSLSSASCMTCATGSYPYVGFNSNNVYFWSASSSNTTRTSIRWWKEVISSTTYYWTDPVVAAHEHSMEYVPAVAATCTEAGNTAYYVCTDCGKCFTDADGETEITVDDTVIAALGHDYVATVTPPTETQQGYTTHVCSRCGDTYVDSYVPALGSDYTVHFSVPAGVTAPADMVSNTNTGITLPTVEGPEGYTFLGWVTEDYDNVQTRPAEILTGNYIAPQEITLKALFTYNDYGENGPKLTLMTTEDTFSDGDKIVITAAGTNHGLYRETYNRTYASDFDFTNDAAAILADPKMYFPVKQVDGGWWLGDNDNGWLYTPDNQVNLTLRSYDENFMTAFELTTYDGHLALLHTVSYNDNRFYLKCGTDFSGSIQNKWRMINLANGATPTGIVTLDIYKLTEGGPAVAFYTTIISEPAHEHTPAEPVIENNVDPTCTEAGHYDSVVYCTECGEEISRETVTVPATGHAYGAPEWTWNADNTAATAKFTCANCGDVQILDAVITETVLTEAKPHVAGEKKLTATVTFNETAYTDEKTVEIEALPCPCADFTDMPAYGTPEHEAIDWAFVNGITAGLSATEFGTNKTLNRAQAATFLYAAAGKPAVDSTATVTFNDVVPSNWYYKPVLWASTNGMVAGYEDGTFKPNNTLTRAQILTILYAWAGKPAVDEYTNPYSDVRTSNWYYAPAVWAYNAGIERGENGKFAQGTNCTRATFVLYLYRHMTGNCLLGD